MNLIFMYSVENDLIVKLVKIVYEGIDEKIGWKFFVIGLNVEMKRFVL